MPNYKTIKNNSLVNLIVMLVLSLSVSGCAVYNSSFSCGDAKGANCMSIDRVDRMIASGEIERFNESLKECKGSKCNKYEGVKSPSMAEKNKNMVIYNANAGDRADIDNIKNSEVHENNTNISDMKNLTNQE